MVYLFHGVILGLVAPLLPLGLSNLASLSTITLASLASLHFYDYVFRVKHFDERMQQEIGKLRTEKTQIHAWVARCDTVTLLLPLISTILISRILLSFSFD